VDELQTIARKCARWAQDHMDALSKADPKVPIEIRNDRHADNWRTLLSIADVIGGDWPKKARDAALKIENLKPIPATQTLGVRLLADIRQVFWEEPKDGKDATLSARTIIDRISILDENPWLCYGKTERLITEHAFAKLLGTFKIHSHRKTDYPDKGKMFWHKADF
jgi:hypothetical protein